MGHGYRILTKAEIVVESLGNRDLKTLPESREIREAGVSKRMEDLLVDVRDTKINRLRNEVVHKRGFRPRRRQAEAAVKEGRSVLFPLGRLLDLHEEINCYYRHSAE